MTQAQYRKLTGVNPSFFAPGPKDSSDAEQVLPVENVSWFDAVIYCNLLSRAEKLTEYYTIGKTVSIADPFGKGYRLPTESEWEYACRGGANGAFHWGSNLEASHANANGFVGKTIPVGRHPANRFGLHDMHGNVWEWCWDYYDEYPPKRGDRSLRTSFWEGPDYPWWRLGIAGAPLPKR